MTRSPGANANGEIRMTRLRSAAARQANNELIVLGDCRIRSSFRGEAAFTILELLIVMSIIIILAGLTIATMGYVQNKSRRSRAEAEIAAISAACENYKADTGIYPRTTGETDKLDPASATLANYAAASLKLYEFLSGDTTDDRK